MVAFNKGLDGFFHSLIPSRLCETLTINTGEYIRARALVVALLISTLVPLIATLVVGGHHLFFSPDLLKHDTVSLAIALLFGLQTLFYYRFGNQWLSSAAFTNTYFILVALLLIMSGGIVSPMKAILVTCPIMSFLIGGRQEGLQSTLITMLFVFGLVVLNAIEFDLPNLFQAESPQMIFIVNWIATVTIMTVCNMVYEAELMNRSQRLKSRQGRMRKSISNLSERFDGFVHGLIPKKLRETLDVDSAGYVRVRILSIMLLIATLMSAVSACVLVSVHYLFYQDQLKYDLVILAIVLIFSIQTWLFYRFNNFWLSALLLSYFYFILALLLVSISGGYDAPTMVLILISPMVFFMLGGLQQGIQNAVYVMMAGVFFGFMKSIGVEFPNVFRAALPVLTYGIAFEIAIIAIALCITVYDSELEEN